MLGVILFFAGQQVFSTYLRPYLEVVGQFTATGVAGFLGTLVAPVILSRSIRWALTSTGAGQALFLALLFVLDTGSQVTAIALIACWGFASGMIGVGWSTWLARTYPEHAEGGGGILVASIQGAMMVGAIIGGGLIDGVGPKGPLAAARYFPGPWRRTRHLRTARPSIGVH
jgi:predicted MFS family arabinose efflux permease